jgi:uncharacterized protein with NRDE domain
MKKLDFSSLKTIVVSPGVLSYRFINGRQISISVFVVSFFIANLIYFAAKIPSDLYIQTENMPYSPIAKEMVEKKIKKNKTNIKQFTLKYEMRSWIISRALLVLTVFYFSLAVYFVNYRKKLTYKDHLAVSFEFMTLAVLYVLVIMSWLHITALNLVIAAVLLYFIERNAYKLKTVWAVANALILAVSFFVVVQVYYASVFFHPVYKLIVAANRDEFYSRKTAAANYWTDYPNVLGGRDLQAGGTWMGMTKSGKISMLTNYRDPKNIKSDAPSRGFLVSDYLEKDIEPNTYLKALQPSKYNGFNLILGTTDDLWYLSNYKDGITKLDNGLYGLSNHLLDTPWPKVVRGKMKLAPILGRSDVNKNDLMEFLYDTEVATDNLPNTGVSPELERALSSMFIKTPNYGSRCSTVILVDNDNHVQFSERVYDLTTFNYKLSEYEFDING